MEVILSILTKYRIQVDTEGAVQRSIQDILEENHLDYIREFRFSERDRVDFLLADGTAIEVKINGWSPMRIYRQLERYAEYDAVQKLLLITAQAIHLPNKIGGKDADVFTLGRAWL